MHSWEKNEEGTVEQKTEVGEIVDDDSFLLTHLWVLYSMPNWEKEGRSSAKEGRSWENIWLW